MLHLQLVCASLLLLLPVIWSGSPCPSSSHLQGCTCTRGKYQEDYERPTTEPPTEEGSVVSKNVEEDGGTFTTVVCNGTSSLSNLADVMTKAFYRKSIDRLLLINLPRVSFHSFAVLPNGWLKNTRVRILQINDSILSSDFISKGSSFEGQEKNLVQLRANRCNLYGALAYSVELAVKTQNLQKLTRLESLDFSGNRLTVVMDAFRWPPINLTSINLSHNSIKKLDPSAFAYVSQLRYLDLSHNLLDSVTRGMFPNTLMNLNLSHNMISSLPTNLFDNMKSLKTVRFQRNNLQTFEEKPWVTAWNTLSFIDASDNYLQCDCSLLWLPNKLATRNRDAVVSSLTLLGSCENFRDSEDYSLSGLTKNQIDC